MSNGKEIPALGLGTYIGSSDPTQVKDLVKTAIKAGYRHIDGAWLYGTEKYVGEGIRESIEEGIVTRDQLFVTTKIWPTYWDKPEKSFDKSLSDLGLEYVDLLLQHWPICAKDVDSSTPLPIKEDGKPYYDDPTSDGTGFIEFYRGIEKLHLDNPQKIRSIGVSNYSIMKLEKLIPKVQVLPVVNQIEYHPQLPQKDLVEYCGKYGIIITAYSPVGSNGAPVLKLPLIQQLADKYEVTTNEVANAYHILQGRASLPRSTNLERIKTTIRLPSLTKSELEDLYQIGVENPKRHITNIWGDELGFDWWY
ncbi:D-arabinose 1-dehydrogenase (NAD(P)(+)) [Yamadazyma tenuis]|nr:D-arabinose 1-dehydrogenase (NAD(P)(+)) [Yamadazyma tenuis]